MRDMRRRRRAANDRRGRRPPTRTRQIRVPARSSAPAATRSMTRNARSADTSMRRRAGSNSTGSKTSTESPSRITCSARRSPWQSRTKPRVARSSSCSWRACRNATAKRCAAASSPAPSASAYGSSVPKFSLTVAATAPGVETAGRRGFGHPMKGSDMSRHGAHERRVSLAAADQRSQGARLVETAHLHDVLLAWIA